MTETTRAKPLRITTNYYPDTDALRVAFVHKDVPGVTIDLNSGYMVGVEMTPRQWKHYLDAVGLELDILAGVCGAGYDERLPPCGKCDRCDQDAEIRRLAEQQRHAREKWLSEHAHAT